MTIEELSLLANARGGTRLVVCGDKNCCSHGIQDLTENWHAHFLYQIFGRVAALERLPNLSRPRQFLETDMANADQLARQVKELKTGDEVLTKRLIKHIRKAKENEQCLRIFTSYVAILWIAPQKLFAVATRKPVIAKTRVE